MKTPESGSSEPTEQPAEGQVEQPINDIKNDMKELSEGKIDMREFQRRRVDSLKRAEIAQQQTAADSSKAKEKLDRAIENFNTTVRKKV
jgi:hypothetical protein